MRGLIGRNLIAGAACLALTGTGLGAQEAPESPNDEPSSFSTLFDRTDSGNVAQAATMAYGAGRRELDRARKLEGKLSELSGAKLEKSRGKIVKAYENAAASFKDAIGSNPKMAEAYAGLSAAFRGSGKYAEALQVSAQGLKVAPESDEVFAGWAQSVLGLNMLGDATQAYATLQENNPARAEILMGAMKDWLAVKSEDPGELAPEAVSRLSEWIAEQGG